MISDQIRADLVTDQWRYVSDAPDGNLETTGTLHLSDCTAFNPKGELREIAPGDVPLRRCVYCERRLSSTPRTAKY
jgi:hypothetical protein